MQSDRKACSRVPCQRTTAYSVKHFRKRILKCTPYITLSRTSRGFNRVRPRNMCFTLQTPQQNRRQVSAGNSELTYIWKKHSLHRHLIRRALTPSDRCPINSLAKKTTHRTEPVFSPGVDEIKSSTSSQTELVL